MRVAVMYGPGDVRVESRPEPTILAPTDAIIRLAASCICGSGLWPYWESNRWTTRDGWDMSTPAS